MFAKHPALPLIVRCPGAELFPTQVPGIFLSVHQPRLPAVAGADVRLSALVEALGAYVQDALELHQGQLQEQAVRQHCLQAQQVGLQEAVFVTCKYTFLFRDSIEHFFAPEESRMFFRILITWGLC